MGQPNLFAVYWVVFDLKELLIEREHCITRLSGGCHKSLYVRLVPCGCKWNLAVGAPWLCQPNLFGVYWVVFDLKELLLKREDYNSRLSGGCHRSRIMGLVPYPHTWKYALYAPWMCQPNLFWVDWIVFDLKELLAEREDYTTRLSVGFHRSPHVRLVPCGCKWNLAVGAPWLCQPNLFQVYWVVFDLKKLLIEREDYNTRLSGGCHRSLHVELVPCGCK
jgi:hypothetical protein